MKWEMFGDAFQFSPEEAQGWKIRNFFDEAFASPESCPYKMGEFEDYEEAIQTLKNCPNRIFPEETFTGEKVWVFVMYYLDSDEVKNIVYFDNLVRDER